MHDPIKEGLKPALNSSINVYAVVVDVESCSHLTRYIIVGCLENHTRISHVCNSKVSKKKYLKWLTTTHRTFNKYPQVIS